MSINAPDTVELIFKKYYLFIFFVCSEYNN